MAKKKLTEAEQAEFATQRERMLANAQRTHELAGRAQSKLDAKSSQRESGSSWQLDARRRPLRIERPDYFPLRSINSIR